MQYTFEVAGISHKNKDGEPRREIVIDNLYPDYSGFSVSLRRHSGNRSDKNAIGVYIEKRCTPMMIGFVPRDLARDISPMIKLGHHVKDIRIVRVWVPTFSDAATPVVTVSFEGNWTQNDINTFKKQLSEERKAARAKKKASVLASQLIETNNQTTSNSLLSRIFSFLTSTSKK